MEDLGNLDEFYENMHQENMREQEREEIEEDVPNTEFNFNEIIEDSMNMEEGEENNSKTENGKKKTMDQRRNEFKDKKTWTRVGCNNVRGIKSKNTTITQIFNNLRYSFLSIAETHCTATEKPPEKGGIKHFSRGRISDNLRVKGGVSVAVEEDLAGKCILVEESEGEREFIGIQCNAFTPPLVIFSYYGQQEARTDKNEIAYCLVDLFQRASKYAMKGSTVLICGDFNNAVGNNLGMTSNHHSVSKGGEQLMATSKEYGFTCVNGLWKGDQSTHWDRSGTCKRALDYIFISDKDMSKVSDVTFDEWDQPEFTPYSTLRGRDGSIEKRFTDHKMIYVDLQLEENKNAQQAESISRWRVTPTGLWEFAQMTDVLAEGLFLDLEDDTVTTQMMVKKIGDAIEHCKNEAFTKVTKTKKKWMELEDEELVSEYANMILEEAKKNRTSKMQPRQKVFKARKNINLANRGQVMAAMKKEDGTMTSTYEETGELLTKYNKELLARNEHEGKFKQVFELKQKLVEDYMRRNPDRKEQTITMDDYEWAIDKVMEAGKGMYKDFIRTGPKFKAVIFYFLKKVFDSESIPESFWKTNLVALHKKGAKDLCSNYRFLHLRSYLSRLFELLVFRRMKHVLEGHCPEHQIGGQPKCQALEHLTMAFENIREASLRKKGVILGLVDVVKMFDNVWLTDAEIELVEGGLDPKILRLHHEICNTNLLSVEGFKYLEFLIKGGLGQGSVLAAADCSLMVARRTEEYIMKNKEEALVVKVGSEEREDEEERNEESEGVRIEVKRGEPMNLKGVDLSHQEFIDDILSQDETVEGAQQSADITSETLDSMALKAHPKKSVMIVTGSEKYREKMLEELKKNPIILQGNQIPISLGDMYLGVKFIEGTLSQIINANVEVKRQKVMVRLIELTRLLQNKRIQICGWLEAVITFLKMIIQPTITWSMAAWPKLKIYQEKAIEGLYKHAACSLLGISAKMVNTSALYLELNTIPIMGMVAYFKITYAAFLIWQKGKGRAFRLLRNQKIDGDENCFASDVEDLCKQYGLESVFSVNHSKEFVRDRVWRVEKMKLIQNVNSSMYLPMISHVTKFRGEHLTYPKMTALALILYNLGRLNFLRSRSKEARQKFGTTECVTMHPECVINEEQDSVEHVLGLNGKPPCPGYESKMMKEMEPEPALTFGRFLVAIHIERGRRWKWLWPLVTGI